MTRTVAVVGAGAAGLCAAKYLVQAGHDVTVFEIGSHIGGLWRYRNDNGRSSAYASLHINSEKRNTQFTDFPFSDDVPVFPSHEDMCRYLESYADHFGVTERIRFNSRITEISPVSGPTGGWNLEIENGQRAEFDSVVVATGHLSDPLMPEFLGDFEGEALHSHDYEEPLRFIGQKVLVVGAGNSACDIAADLCQVGCDTVMSVRSPVLIVPKLIFGVPVTQVVGLFERKWLPSSFVDWARKLVTLVVHGPMEGLGLRTPKGRQHPISHATLVNHIKYQRVRVASAVVAVSGKTVTFADGSSEDFDTIIAATGYELRLPEVPEDIVQVSDDGRMELYKRVIPPGWPGIYFVGFFNTDGLSNLRMFEVQMRLVCALENGEISLPSTEAMRDDIAAMDRWVAETYPPGPRHAIEIDPIKYSADIDDTIRRRRLEMESKRCKWASRSGSTAAPARPAATDARR